MEDYLKKVTEKALAEAKLRYHRESREYAKKKKAEFTYQAQKVYPTLEESAKEGFNGKKIFEISQRKTEGGNCAILQEWVNEMNASKKFDVTITYSHNIIKGETRNRTRLDCKAFFKWK